MTIRYAAQGGHPKEEKGTDLFFHLGLRCNGEHGRIGRSEKVKGSRTKDHGLRPEEMKDLYFPRVDAAWSTGIGPGRLLSVHKPLTFWFGDFSSKLSCRIQP